MAIRKAMGRVLVPTDKDAKNFIDAAGLDRDSNLNVEGLYTAQQARYAVDFLVKGLKGDNIWSKIKTCIPVLGITGLLDIKTCTPMISPIGSSGGIIRTGVIVPKGATYGFESNVEWLDNNFSFTSFVVNEGTVDQYPTLDGHLLSISQLIASGVPFLSIKPGTLQGQTESGGYAKNPAPFMGCISWTPNSSIGNNRIVQNCILGSYNTGGNSLIAATGAKFRFGVNKTANSGVFNGIQNCMTICDLLTGNELIKLQSHLYNFNSIISRNPFKS